MMKRIDFDYNGEMYGIPVDCEKAVTAEELKTRKAQFKGVKDSLVLEADNDLETLMTCYQVNRNSKTSRNAVINCLRKLAVVRA